MSEVRRRILVDPARRGKEIFEIKPVILGGNPVDPTNKMLLSRDEHIKALAYWNRVIRDLRQQASGTVLPHETA